MALHCLIQGGHQTTPQSSNRESSLWAVPIDKEESLEVQKIDRKIDFRHLQSVLEVQLVSQPPG